ncbi:hypothetical protein BT69DRAFT_312710 [Atractiella rhizophila]|nr:hypothetical protein BT69DRAFT_312710 [Atractiella rhizophila]
MFIRSPVFLRCPHGVYSFFVLSPINITCGQTVQVPIAVTSQALRGGLSATTTIAASIRKNCTEEQAAKYRDKKARFALVLSIYWDLSLMVRSPLLSPDASSSFLVYMSRSSIRMYASRQPRYAKSCVWNGPLMLASELPTFH